MMKSKVVLVAIALSVLAGCASQSTPENEVPFVRFAAEQVHEVATPKGPVIRHTSLIGSGVSWNEDYVVTANHVVVEPIYGPTEYTCDNGCDLKFVRRKAEGRVPQWRERQSKESLSAIGVTIKQSRIVASDVRREKIIAHGKDADIATTTTGDSKNWLLLARMDTVSGMSGGPLYGKDNKVVGILTGNTQLRQSNGSLYDMEGDRVAEISDADPAYEGKTVAYAIYIPYGMIKAHWEHFQAKKNALAQASH